MTSNVLITSAGRRVSLVEGFRDTCQSDGRLVHAADSRPDLSAACCKADASHRLSPSTDPNFATELLALCKRLDIGLVVPTIDTELPVLAAERDRFVAEGIRLVVSDPTLVADCADKRRTHRLFERHGLNHPATYTPANIGEFPIFAKPYDGSLSRGIEVLHDAADMLRATASSDRLMLCEYLGPERHDEFTIDCYFDSSSTLRCAVPRQRLEVRAGEVSKARTVRNELVGELFTKLSVLHGALGVLTIQAFVERTNRTTSFFEINARFGGGYPLTRHAGADYQRLLVDEHLRGVPARDVDDWQDDLLMLRYDAEVIRPNV